MISNNYLEARNQKQQSQDLLSSYKQSLMAADADFSERQNNYKASQDAYQNSQTSYNKSRSVYNQAKSTQDASKRGLDRYKGFNSRKENRIKRKETKKVRKLGSLSRRQFKRLKRNKKKDYTDRYRNFNQYRRARRKSRRRLNSSKKRISGYNAARSNYSRSQSSYQQAQTNLKNSLANLNSTKSSYNSSLSAFNKSQTAQQTASSNYAKQQQSHAALSDAYQKQYAETDANFTVKKQHSHSTWQDKINGNTEYTAFGANTDTTSYGVAGKDYKYKAADRQEYAQQFNSPEEELAAVKNATKAYGGVLPYGGKAEDYKLTSNGLLIPKGSDYTYNSDKSLIGTDGYKSKGMLVSGRTMVKNIGAQKYNEQSEAMSNFRKVHQQSTYDNVDYLNQVTSDTSGQWYESMNNERDLSNIARYQNSFYNRGVKAEKAKTYSGRTDYSAAKRKNDTWLGDNMTADTYWTSYSGYDPDKHKQNTGSNWSSTSANRGPGGKYY